MLLRERTCDVVILFFPFPFLLCSCRDESISIPGCWDGSEVCQFLFPVGSHISRRLLDDTFSIFDICFLDLTRIGDFRLGVHAWADPVRECDPKTWFCGALAGSIGMGRMGGQLGVTSCRGRTAVQIKA